MAHNGSEMITPQEIRQHTFKKSLRGYDKEEVEAFLQALAQEWAQQLDANQQVKEELERTKASYRTLKEVEDMLHRTLMQAEQSARDTVENARQKAELKVREAEVRAQDILRKGVDDRTDIQREITELIRRRDQLFSQLQIFLKTQLERMQDFDRIELPAYNASADLSRQIDQQERREENHNFFDQAETPAHNGSGGKQGMYDDIVDEL
jgi:cell division initiation protein